MNSITSKHMQSFNNIHTTSIFSSENTCIIAIIRNTTIITPFGV